MRTIHKAIFFKTEEDIKMRRAFILRWFADDRLNRAGFSIEPPEAHEDVKTVSTEYTCTIDEDFRGMVHMMKLMINPVAVVVDGARE